MKKIFFVLCSGLLLAMPFCFGQCKKEKETHTGLTITLSDKPLDTIRFYIQGKWKCHYGKGGIGNTIQYYENYYWTFTSNGVVQSYNETIISDTTIMWYEDTDNYSGSTYIMKFYDKQNVPWNYVVDGIYNDTLIMHDFSSDAMFYHFTKL